jgi:hypothetical protein
MGIKHKNSKMKGLRIHVMPFSEVKDLGISERVRKILGQVLGNKIVIFHGRLRAEEEARLIEDTMAMVDHISHFKGIELAVIEPDMSEKNLIAKMKHGIAKRLVGDNSTLTVIGPASVIKDIKRDPRRMELLLN